MNVNESSIVSLGRALARARHLPDSLGRVGLRPALLGAVLVVASTATALGAANSPPEIISATASAAVLNEGQTVTLSVAFTDPDPADLHTLRIKWFEYDGAPTQEVQLPAGQTSVQVKHTYVDGPLWSPRIQVTLYDRQTRPGAPNDNTGGAGQDYVAVPIQVNNVAPGFVPNSVTVRKKAGRQFVVEGDLVDPSTRDALTVGATWSDPLAPAATACSLNKNRHFQCEHTYSSSLPAQTYQILLTARDDDGGETKYQTFATLP
jgi:hypothetical protein